MKTINELLEYLSYNERDVYTLTDLENKVLICREGIMGSILLMTVYKSNSGFPFEWHISSDFHFEQFSVQEKIMRFFINSNPNHWFDEPEKNTTSLLAKICQVILRLFTTRRVIVWMLLIQRVNMN